MEIWRQLLRHLLILASKLDSKSAPVKQNINRQVRCQSNLFTLKQVHDESSSEAAAAPNGSQCSGHQLTAPDCRSIPQDSSAATAVWSSTWATSTTTSTGWPWRWPRPETRLCCSATDSSSSWTSTAASDSASTEREVSPLDSFVGLNATEIEQHALGAAAAKPDGSDGWGTADRPENFVMWVAPYRWPAARPKPQIRGKQTCQLLASRPTVNHHVFDLTRRQGKLVVDVHQLWIRAPLGMSVFQTDKERKRSQARASQIRAEFKKHKEKMRLENKPRLDDAVWIPEPQPGHNFCQICKIQIFDYFMHIDSFEHNSNWNTIPNSTLFQNIDDLLKIISKDHFSEIKDKRVYLIEEKENNSHNYYTKMVGYSKIQPYSNLISTKHAEESIPQMKTSYSSNACRRQTLSSALLKSMENSSGQNWNSFASNNANSISNK